MKKSNNRKYIINKIIALIMSIVVLASSVFAFDFAFAAETQLQIISNPQNIEAKIGDVASFSVSASGTGLKYTWQHI